MIVLSLIFHSFCAEKYPEIKRQIEKPCDWQKKYSIFLEELCSGDKQKLAGRNISRLPVNLRTSLSDMLPRYSPEGFYRPRSLLS